jgi:hypothetical protein
MALFMKLLGLVVFGSLLAAHGRSWPLGPE